MLKVILNCDNSKVKYEIKQFKFIFVRLLSCKNSLTGENITLEEIIFLKNELGVARNKQSKREFSFDLSSTESKAEK